MLQLLGLARLAFRRELLGIFTVRICFGRGSGIIPGGALGDFGQAAAAGAATGPVLQAGGPSASNLCFQAYMVCLERPTRAAKSPAGRLLRRQVSNRSRRCSPVRGGAGPSAFRTMRWPRGGVARTRGPGRRGVGAGSGGIVLLRAIGVR